MEGGKKELHKLATQMPHSAWDWGRTKLRNQNHPGLSTGSRHLVFVGEPGGVFGGAVPVPASCLCVPLEAAGSTEVFESLNTHVGNLDQTFGSCFRLV